MRDVDSYWVDVVVWHVMCSEAEVYGVGFFFFKQKPAYDMGISDWSSDVCSSDLPPLRCIGVVKQRPLQEVGNRGRRRGHLALQVGRSDGGECFRHDSLCVDPDPCAAPVTDHDLGFACIEVHGAMIEGQVDMRVVSFDGGQAREEPEPREGRAARHSTGLTSAPDRWSVV